MLTKSTLIATLTAVSIFASMPAAYASVDVAGRDKTVQTEHHGKVESRDRGGRSHDKKDHGAKDHRGSRDRSRDSRSGRSAGK